MLVLVDSSVWIDYFKLGIDSNELDNLIDDNLVYTNDLILTELMPFLKLKKKSSLIESFKELSSFPLSINWQEIQDFQLKCLESGINGIGIPDLIITQNARQNDSYIFSLDKHFNLMKEVLDIKLY